MYYLLYRFIYKTLDDTLQFHLFKIHVYTPFNKLYNNNSRNSRMLEFLMAVQLTYDRRRLCVVTCCFSISLKVQSHSEWLVMCYDRIFFFWPLERPT